MALKSMPLWKHAFAYITLGLLCGWYYMLMFLYPLLMFLTYRGSYAAGVTLLTIIV